MKKNAIASLALAFATAFALADNLGTATKVGSLSRSTDYVYTADQADAVVTAAKNAASAYTTAVSNKLDKVATTTAAGLMSAADKTKLDGVATGANAGFTSVSAGGTSQDADATHTTVVFTGSNLSVEVQSAAPGALVQLSVPDASTAAKGVVQLSASTNGTSTAKAATESAVKDAIAAAKAYADAKAATGVSRSAVAAALTAQGITSADKLDDMDALAAQIAKIVAVLEALD